MRKRVTIMFLICCFLAALGSAEEAAQPTAEKQAPVFGSQVVFSELLPLIGGGETVAAAAGGVVNATCTATCNDGSTVSCPQGTSCGPAVDSDCGGSPSHRGYVICGPFTIWCEAQCPCGSCPETPGCNYEHDLATGCCVDSEDPVNCPEICE